jgi:hypothetical protein
MQQTWQTNTDAILEAPKHQAAWTGPEKYDGTSSEKRDKSIKMSMVISTRRVIHFQSSIQEAAEFSDSFSQ